ncbi:hypothetical protein [Yoonia sp.]|uniref:hypothetical protein n=1 Tax=Yoonia sp. TaxID=2212373 RepID=UPI002FD988A3
MGPRWFVMMKRWAQNPPSPAKIKFVFAIIALCIAIVIIETVFGWPEWLTPTSVSAPR